MIETLHPIEKASIDELRAHQVERLRWSLNHAYTGNPRYRAKFDAAGVHPDDFRTLEDISRFPFTTKTDLRDAYPFDFFAVPQENLARIHASSGTTGKPVVVGYTKADLDIWAQVVARSIHAAGGRSGMKAHIAFGYGLFTGGLGAHYGAEALGCAVIPMGGGQTEKQIQLIADFQPDIIMVTPSYLLAMLDEYYKRGIDPAATSLKIGIFGAEPWTEAMRREIENAFEINAVDIYGLSEVMGPGVAQECGVAKDGPTIWEDHFYPEIIDPETGEVLPDGQEGELVFTSLTKEAMPVVRYRTRDLTRLLPGTSRPMRRIAKITGRSDDMLIVRGVNVFPSQIEEIILTCASLSPHYAVELTRPGRMDVVALEVEHRPGAMEQEYQRDTRELTHKIKSLIGISVNVVIRQPGSIPRSEGKARRITDKRGILGC